MFNNIQNLIPRNTFNIVRFGSSATKKKDSKKPPKEEKKPPNMKTFQIYRYDPEGKSKKPTMKSYTIDLNDCRPTILDALMKIKTEQDSSLSFRKSCREGICGSCGMNIDGLNALACTRKIQAGGKTKIYPLPHMYVIKDLIVDFTHFLKQHDRIKPFLIRDEEPIKNKQFVQSIKDRDDQIGLAECILCACCSTSCPEYWWHGHSKAPDDFLGPAALLNAYRWVTDSRDRATDARLKELKNYYSLYRCHQINNCSTCCPKRLIPGRAIAKLRLLVGDMVGKKVPDLHGVAVSDPLKACGKKVRKS
ncbi:unnamed protein product [Phyllotreta striolata]|uniref:Succinate dehydrogenase [ubiquinone] iron-sulfur subunit, mitochondrial n=1 Tax=Phyllotreta striolata TaxID=444603 RepID=A0A9N9TYQ1_PHYSR|nr:unnamed protein product [Phyllotreta striolata]